jgi:hypothetical protein
MPLRERTWLDDFLDAPLPDTPAKLLDECEKLRRRLIERIGTDAIVSRAPEVTERFWEAMRRQGGAVPRRPPLQACSEAAAFADLLLDKELLEALHRAVDAVAAWCEGRGAVGAAGGAPAEAEQPEGTGTHSEQGGAESAEKPDANLSPSRMKAYQQYRWAVEQNAELNGATDRKVYDWLAEHLDDGEQLPSFATWDRYVRKARAAENTRKNTPRRRRQTGRSIVRPDEI